MNLYSIELFYLLILIIFMLLCFCELFVMIHFFFCNIMIFTIVLSHPGLLGPMFLLVKGLVEAVRKIWNRWRAGLLFSCLISLILLLGCCHLIFLLYIFDDRLNIFEIFVQLRQKILTWNQQSIKGTNYQLKFFFLHWYY